MHCLKNYKVILIDSNLEKGMKVNAQRDASVTQCDEFIQLYLSFMDAARHFSIAFVDKFSQLNFSKTYKENLWMASK